MDATRIVTRSSHKGGFGREPLSRLLLLRYWLYSLPIAATFWFIWQYGVNLPFLDDWIVPGDLRRCVTIRGFVAALFRGDTDHPILFPKLILLFLAHFTQWNVKIGMFVVLLSSVITFVTVTYLAESEERHSDLWTIATAGIVSGLLMFSFVHYDTWLHDWQLTHDMGDMFAVIAIAVVTLSHSSPIRRLLGAWMLCLAASLCYLGGLAAWIAVLPCALPLFRDIRGRLLVCAGCGGFALLDWLFLKYAFVVNPFPTDRLFWLKHPSLGFEYFTNLLGAPLGQAGFVSPATLAPVVGVVLLVLLLLSVGRIVSQRDRYPSASAWLSLALFGLGVASMNTIGRGSFTPPIAATTSRYMIDSVLVAVAAVHLARLTLRRSEFAVFAGLFGILSILSSTAALVPAEQIRAARLRAADCLVAAGYLSTRADDYEFGTLYPICPLPGCIAKFRGNFRIAEGLGLHGMSLHLPFIDDPKLVYGEFISPAASSKPVNLKAEDNVTASGWTAIPDQPVPKCVLITDGQEGIVATRVDDGGLRWTKDAANPKPRWSVTIPAKFLPTGETILKAWAYDARGRFVKLLDYGSAKRISRK